MTITDSPNVLASIFPQELRSEALALAQKITEATEALRADIVRAHDLCHEGERLVEAVYEGAKDAGLSDVPSLDGAMAFAQGLTGAGELNVVLSNLSLLADPDEAMQERCHRK